MVEPSKRTLSIMYVYDIRKIKTNRKTDTNLYDMNTQQNEWMKEGFERQQNSIIISLVT